MAIRTNKVEVPSDEIQNDTTTVNEPEVETSAHETQAETKVQTQAPAPAVRAPSAVAVAVVGNEAPTFTALFDALDPEEYGNVFKRLVGGNGAIMDQDKRVLGEWVDMQVYSVCNHRWMITPAKYANGQPIDAKDNKAKFACRASYDGKTILDREGDRISIEDYHASMVKEYSEWKLSKYMDIYGIILGSDKNQAIGAELGIVQASISPTATKAFTNFFMQSRLSVVRGLMAADKQNMLRLIAEGKSNDGGNYTIIKPGHIPLDVLAGYTPLYM